MPRDGSSHLPVKGIFGRGNRRIPYGEASVILGALQKRAAKLPVEVTLSDANEWRPMLELRPTCENCNKPLPPDSLEARICSYECTFCASCVDEILDNVCPNCGGGFVPRPIRPRKNWKNDNFLGKDPASTKVRHRPVDPVVHAEFAASITALPAEER